MSRRADQTDSKLSFFIKLFSNYNFIQIPDFIHILLNSSVRCKFTCTSSIQERHLRPSFFVSISFLYFFLCCCIRFEISQNKVSICLVTAVCVQQRIIDSLNILKSPLEYVPLMSCISTFLMSGSLLKYCIGS